MLRSDISVPESSHIERIDRFCYLFEDLECLFFFDDLVFQKTIQRAFIRVGDEDKSFRDRVGILDFQEMLGEHLIAKVAENGLVILCRLEDVELM